MEDELCLEFARASRIDVFNPTGYSLYIGDGGGVFTYERIYANTMLGELKGTPEFVFDITHFDYIILDSDYVLDVSKNQPRSILTWVRCDYNTSNASNCIVRTEVDEIKRETVVTLWTTRRIDVGEELVYRVII